MSSEITQISTSDAILRIKNLIELNQGDKGRLEYIMETLQKGKNLFHSDQIYLYAKISAEVIPIPKKEPSQFEEKLKNVKNLISLKLGDPERLRYMAQRLQKNKDLYHSDEKYLESKSEQILNLRQRINIKRKNDLTIPSSLKPKIQDDSFKKLIKEKTSEQTNKTISKDIPKLVEKDTDKISSLDFEDASKIFNNVKENLDYNSEFENERVHISRLKLENEQIKIQRDELTRLITYRQEYEIKINHESELLEKETKIAQEEIKTKDILVDELITNQSTLIQIKTEREVLVEQIRIYKTNAENELEKKQKELEALKIEYQTLQEKQGNEQWDSKISTDSKFPKIKESNLKKSLKGKLEMSIVALGMIVGFSAIMMKLADFWPCDILEILSIHLPLIC